MKTEELINVAENSLTTLLDLMRKEISLSELVGDEEDGEEIQVEEWKYKIIIEGRKQLLDDAKYHIDQIKHLEQKSGVGEDVVEQNHRTNLQDLVDSCVTFEREVKKVLEMRIDVDESDDEKVKAISQAKTAGLQLLIKTGDISEEIKEKLKSDRNITRTQKRNIVTERIKGGV